MRKITNDDARRQLIDAALEFCYEIRNRPIAADIVTLPDLRRAALDYLETGEDD